MGTLAVDAGQPLHNVVCHLASIAADLTGARWLSLSPVPNALQELLVLSKSCILYNTGGVRYKGAHSQDIYSDSTMPDQSGLSDLLAASLCQRASEKTKIDERHWSTCSQGNFKPSLPLLADHACLTMHYCFDHLSLQRIFSPWGQPGCEHQQHMHVCTMRFCST